MEVNDITKTIIGCAIRVHTALGPGLLESAYEECLAYEMEKEGLFVERQRGLPLVYESVKMDVGYRVDLLVNGKVILELKSVDAISAVHIAQVLTYLRLSNCKVALLINFNVTKLKNGIKRYIND